MIVKKHIANGKLVLAVCDTEILGKKFEEKNFQLDLSSSFYNGKNIEEELKKLIKKTYIANIVGEKSIGFFVKEGLLDKDKIVRVANIPHSQLFIGIC